MPSISKAADLDSKRSIISDLILSYLLSFIRVPLLGALWHSFIITGNCRPTPNPDDAAERTWATRRRREGVTTSSRGPLGNERGGRHGGRSSTLAHNLPRHRRRNLLQQHGPAGGQEDAHLAGDPNPKPGRARISPLGCPLLVLGGSDVFLGAHATH